jgi:endonuclease/exonuclease/phosphatase family metal-dependent hydrolase
MALAACGGKPDPAAASDDAVASADASAGRAGCRHPGVGGGKVVGVLSRNLYLGADLTPVIQAQDFQQFLAATTAVWATVNDNDFRARAVGIADEIAGERPALIGLQEAYLWRIQDPGDFLSGGTTPATTVVYDYVSELLAALADRGLHYEVAAEVTLFDFEAPIATGQDVRLTDRGVILARSGLKIANPLGQVFSTLLPLPVLGQILPVQRGWVSVEVKHRGEELRFVSTHLESFHPAVRIAQAAELRAALEGEQRPVVLVGDLNSEPGTEGEAVLAEGGFADVWAAVHPGSAGYTCCWPEDLGVPSPPAPPLDQRIDYVLARGPLLPLEAEVLGDEEGDRVAVEGTARQLWPSDHGGVLARLRILAPSSPSRGPSRSP